MYQIATFGSMTVRNTLIREIKANKMHYFSTLFW